MWKGQIGLRRDKFEHLASTILNVRLGGERQTPVTEMVERLDLPKGAHRSAYQKDKEQDMVPTICHFRDCLPDRDEARMGLISSFG